MTGLWVFIMLIGAVVLGILWGWRDLKGMDVAGAVIGFLLVAALEGWGLYAYSQFGRDVRFERMLEVAIGSTRAAASTGAKVDSAWAAIEDYLPAPVDSLPAFRLNSGARL